MVGGQAEYGVTAAERDAMARVLATCPNQGCRRPEPPARPDIGHSGGSSWKLVAPVRVTCEWSLRE